MFTVKILKRDTMEQHGKSRHEASSVDTTRDSRSCGLEETPASESLVMVDWQAVPLVIFHEGNLEDHTDFESGP